MNARRGVFFMGDDLPRASNITNRAGLGWGRCGTPPPPPPFGSCRQGINPKRKPGEVSKIY